jgi:hypothetical protein
VKTVQLALASMILLACGRRAEIEACNIAQRSCQEDIYYEIVRLRGDGFDPFQGVPPMRTITLGEYRDELTADQAPPAQAPAPKEPPKIDPVQVAFQLLGLVARTTSTAAAAIDDRVNNVAAFYDWNRSDVTVIDRGDEHNDGADTTLLAHELVHAFQHAEQSLGATLNTTDSNFADQALVEGEAVLYEHLIGAEIQGIPPRQVDWKRYYAGWTASLRASMVEWTADRLWTHRLSATQAKSPYYAVSWFVYPFGANLLTNAWLEGGNSAVRKLATDAPRHSLHFMASMAGVKPSPSATLPCQVEPPAKSFTRIVFDRFGAMQVYAFLGAQGLDEATSWAQALHWRDDLIWIYFDEKSQTVAVSWRIRFSQRSAADLAFTAIATSGTLERADDGADAPSSYERVAKPSALDRADLPRLPALSASRHGDDLVITGSNDADLLASWPGASECAASL